MSSNAMSSNVLEPREKPASPPRASSGLSVHTLTAALVGAAVIGLIWIMTAWWTPEPIIREMVVVRPDRGDFEVHYAIQDNETTSSASTLGGVSAIESSEKCTSGVHV